MAQDNYPHYTAQRPPQQYSAITAQNNPSFGDGVVNTSAPPSRAGDTSASTSSPVTPSSIHSQPPTLARTMSYEHVPQQHPPPSHMQHQDYHTGGYPHGIQHYAPPQQLPAHHPPHPHPRPHPHSQHPHPHQHYQHASAHQGGNAGYESPVTPAGSDTFGPPNQLYPEVNPAAPPISSMQELPQGFGSAPSSPTEYRRPPRSSASSTHSESTESYHSAGSSSDVITRGQRRRAARDAAASPSSTASAAASGGAGGRHGGGRRTSRGSADESDPESELLAAVAAECVPLLRSFTISPVLLSLYSLAMHAVPDNEEFSWIIRFMTSRWLLTNIPNFFPSLRLYSSLNGGNHKNLLFSGIILVTAGRLPYLTAGLPILTPCHDAPCTPS